MRSLEHLQDVADLFVLVLGLRAAWFCRGYVALAVLALVIALGIHMLREQPREIIFNLFTIGSVLLFNALGSERLIDRRRPLQINDPDHAGT